MLSHEWESMSLKKGLPFEEMINTKGYFLKILIEILMALLETCIF